MKRLRLQFTLIAIILGATSAVAHAWDPTGHMLVGEIAWEKSAPATRDAVNRLVAGLDSKYNENKPYNFVTSGCWMDDMRSEPKYPWGPLHYVTIPYTPTGSAFTEPAPPHLLSALDEKIALLKDPKSSEAARTEAVAMVIHLIGDLHQPLHTTEWDDRGGNGFLIYGVPFSDLLKKQGANLHTYWDKAFRFDGKEGKIVEVYQAPSTADRPGAPGEGIIHAEAEKIMAEFPAEALPQLKEGDIRAWARESHLIGCLFVYPPKPHPTNAEVVTLDPDYARKSRPIACERVALAGYRLARVLDDLFAH